MSLKKSGSKLGGQENLSLTLAASPALLMTAISIVAMGLCAPTAQASTPATEFERITQLVKLPYPVTITHDGELRADKSKWTSSKESDGTELLTSKEKEPAEARVAVIRSKTTLESFTSYSLKAAATGTTTKPETSSSVFFDQGKLAAFTMCEDSGGKDSLGRTCVTATPKLCQDLKKSEPIEEDTMKKVDSFEMRAIATILTLRGADHQLDNVVRTGNRLGLKSALQTTKGQLVALSKQISKELASQTPDAASTSATQLAANSPTAPVEKSGNREPANVSKTAGKVAAPRSALSAVTGAHPSEKKIVVSAETSHSALEEDAKTRTQLEHTIPLLQQACADTGFLQ